MKKTVLMLGTRKGAFLAWSDESRSDWTLGEPAFKGCEVNHVACIWRPAPRLMVAGKSHWWGPATKYSDDLGETWLEPERDIRFAEGGDHVLERVWCFADGAADGAVYAGVDPAALFRSTDGGVNWEEVPALTAHPTRDKWFPGKGGLMVHSICPGKDAGQLFAGVSAAGVFRSDDGGESWLPRNHGVRADFLPEKYPDVGQCVHHLASHPSKPGVLYQQNHCGVYRTDDAGETWVDISEGLPSRFGFPVAVHPLEGDMIFVIPEESDEHRMMPDGAFRVYRSMDAGRTWEPMTNGLPQSGAYQNVLRQGMAFDQHTEPGLYVGTQGGQLLASLDNGESWEVLFNWLPPIYSVEAAVIDG